MKGGIIGVKKKHSHTKAQRCSCPSNHFSTSFPFFSLFQTLSFPDTLAVQLSTLYHQNITQSTSLSCVTHMHTHNEHKHKPTQHSIHFIVFLSCSFFSFITSFFINKSLFDYHYVMTMHNVSNNIH